MRRLRPEPSPNGLRKGSFSTNVRPGPGSSFSPRPVSCYLDPKKDFLSLGGLLSFAERCGVS